MWSLFEAFSNFHFCGENSVVKNSISLSSLLFCFKTQRKRTQTRIKKHTQTRYLLLLLFRYNGFFIPSVQLVPSRRVPGGDKRSVRFARFIPFGKRGEGLLRVSIVHRVGVLSGAFVLSRGFFFQTTRSLLFLGASLFARVFGGVSAVVLSRFWTFE